MSVTLQTKVFLKPQLLIFLVVQNILQQICPNFEEIETLPPFLEMSLSDIIQTLHEALPKILLSAYSTACVNITTPSRKTYSHPSFVQLILRE